jgi:hypothetical protein
VDFVVKNADEIQPTAFKVAGEVFKLPDAGRVLTKGLLRNELGRAWGDINGLQEEGTPSMGIFNREDTVNALKAVMSRLSKQRASQNFSAKINGILRRTKFDVL